MSVGSTRRRWRGESEWMSGSSIPGRGLSPQARRGARAFACSPVLALRSWPSLAAGPGVTARRGSAGPGDPCRSDSQCLGADAPLVCDWNGFGYDGELNCCTYEGNRCGFDASLLWAGLLHRRLCSSWRLRECRQRWRRECECPGWHHLDRRCQQRGQRRQRHQRRQYPGRGAGFWRHRLQHHGHLGVR